MSNNETFNSLNIRRMAHEPESPLAVFATDTPYRFRAAFANTIRSQHDMKRPEFIGLIHKDTYPSELRGMLNTAPIFEGGLRHEW